MSAPAAGGDRFELTVDGRTVAVAPGETLLTAIRRAGAWVPTLCHADGLAPEGNCRLCLVEAGGALRAACHTPCEPGWRVVTGNGRLEQMRRGLLELIVSANGDGRFGPDPAGNELAALMARLGVPAAAPPAAAPAADRSHPYLRYDPGLCIVCRRCVHACEEVQGQFVYAVAGRGGEARLVFGPGAEFADSACTACGACVERCPTGALFDRDRENGVEPGAAVVVTDTVCGYCGVGCRLRVTAAGGRVTAIGGVAEAAVNRGHLCAKGRYAHAWHRSAERLTEPLLRRDGRLEPVSWPEAIAFAARRLREIAGRSGPAAVGVLTSSRSTNEAAYLLQKLFRTALGTNNVDCCARVCHSSTALALGLVTGTGAATASYADLERARTIVVAGANPTEAHPVVGARIKQAALAGARLIVVDPRRIELADYADLHLALTPGTNVALFNAVAAALIEPGGHAAAYLAERTEGFDELAAFLSLRPIAEAARVTGVGEQGIRALAAALAEGPALFVHGLGLSELTQGTASVMTLANLAMLTGSVGRPGAGLLPLRGQNNVQGNADVGSMPDRATGYQPLDDPDARARLAAVWGREPPLEPGLTVTEMLEAAAEGRLRALWIQGEDVAQSDPCQERVLAGLRSLDLLVVQELFLTDTAREADLVLPAAGFLEQDGTFTNAERRVQLVRRAVPPPGRARPDWEVAADLARELGEEWSYADPGAVMEEIARAAPALFGGISYPRLEGDGLQWPCPEPGHPGTATVHADGFLRGRGRLVAIDHEPAPEHGVEGFPLLLITGRVLQQYNVGTMTRRTPHRELAPADVLELHPDDARRHGLDDGALAEVESRWGRTRCEARRSPRIAPGTAFLSFHHPETHTNRLVGPHRDPQSMCPDYKVVAVRVRPASAAHRGGAEPPADAGRPAPGRVAPEAGGG